MFSQPGASLGTIVAGKVVVDQEDIAYWIVGFNVRKQRDVVGGVARSGTSGEIAIAHPQRSIHPGLLRPAIVIERRFDAVPTGRPAGCGRERAGNYRPEFIGADGRRPLGRLAVGGSVNQGLRPDPGRIPSLAIPSAQRKGKSVRNIRGRNLPCRLLPRCTNNAPDCLV
jgi:hypothetical protein